MAGIATSVDCWNDLIARVKAVPEFAEKCESVLSADALISILKGAKLPFAGVIYGGLQSNAGDPSRQGLAADFSCTVLVIIQGNAIGNLDQKNEAVRLLQAIRDQVRAQPNSPTLHKWRFVREYVSGVYGNAVVYNQVWTTFFPTL